MTSNESAPTSYQESGSHHASYLRLSADQAYCATSRINSFPRIVYKLVLLVSIVIDYLCEAFKNHKASIRSKTIVSLDSPIESKVVYVVPSWASKCGSIKWQRWSLQKFIGKVQYYEVQYQSITKLTELIADICEESTCRYLIIDSRLLVGTYTGFKYLGSLLRLSLLSRAAARKNVQLICWSMDNTDARFDLVSSLITSKNGIVHSQVCSPHKTLRLHRRQIGPGPWCLIPQDIAEAQQITTKDIDVYFGGSLYPNRTQVLDRVANGLERHLVNYLYTSKNDVPWISYLRILKRSKIVVHTSTYSENKSVTQFHNKAMESTQMGCLLVAQQTEELDDFFGPLEGYVPFTTADEAVQICLHYLGNALERDRISRHGQELANFYATALRPWPEIFDAMEAREPSRVIS